MSIYKPHSNFLFFSFVLFYFSFLHKPTRSPVTQQSKKYEKHFYEYLEN